MTFRFCLFYFFLFFGFGAHLPMFSLYLKSFGLSGVEIGILLSAGPIVSILVQPVWGMITDRFQAQKQVLAGALLAGASLGLLFPSVNGRYGWLLLLYILLIVFQSAVVPVIDAMTLDFFQGRKTNYGSIRMFGAVGFAIAVWLAGQLAERFGLTIIFYLYAGAFVSCAYLALLLPKRKLRRSSGILTDVGSLLRIPSYLLFLIAAFLIFGPIYANNSYFPLFYTAIGGAVSGVGLAFLLFAGSEAPFMKMADWLMGRIGMLTLVILAGLVSAARWFFYASGPSPLMVISFFLLQGFSVGLFLPIAANFIRHSAPERVQVTAQAIYAAMANGLGTMAASYTAGWLYDRFGVLSIYQYFAWSSLSGALLLAVLFVLQKVKPRRRTGII
ncbi:MFS transporter [Effusibacillus dendaii]|uniref:MFS transporter n=1 Tax=Effusibacillus dendaii TaxID=2743772 RepID=A0A7I8DED4_9BACL|nr:MFS transporter [Effusibacillus dendaii]BCJ87206.1 MFS transporter [Effusibacillus dendaii]